MAAPSFRHVRASTSRVWVLNAPIDAITLPYAMGRPAPAYAVVGLPDGLRFDPATRRLSGTPTAAGAGSITIRAVNADGAAEWTVDYETDAAAVQLTQPVVGVGELFRAFGDYRKKLPPVLMTGDTPYASIGGSMVMPFGLLLHVSKGGPGLADFKDAIRKDAVLQFSCRGVQLALRLGADAGQRTHRRVDYFLTHPPVFGSYRALCTAIRDTAAPVMFSVHHPLLAVQGSPVAARLTGAGGAVSAALALTSTPPREPVAARLTGAGGTVAAAPAMSPAPPDQPVAARLAGAGGTVAAALAMSPRESVAAALAGAGGTVAAALTVLLPVAPPAPLGDDPAAAAGARAVTVEGDVLDAVCWRHYGTDAAAAVPAVLAANPGLADAAPVLPAGVVVELPELPAPAVRAVVRLWGPK